MSALVAPKIIGIGLKMYLSHAQQREWLTQVREEVASHPEVCAGNVGAFVLPTFPSLTLARDLLTATRVEWGAQDIAELDSGPFTGEVSGVELAEVGCRFVEVGHAERRRHFREDDDVVAAKTAAAFRNGLTPVLCVGELESSDLSIAAGVCVRQVCAAVRVARDDGVLRPLIIAYEPVWAIGAADPASVDHVLGVVEYLRAEILAGTVPAGSRVIYGGSARAGLLKVLGKSIDGLFLGRAGHDVSVVRTIIDEAASVLSTD